jgi:transcriptional regulator with XRE-family HTH domain
MKAQKILSNRIKYYCRSQDISYYMLSYRSTVPLVTLMHILHGRTRNPGIFTVMKICSGLNVTLPEFFSSEEFLNLEYEVE